jgi:hypothetical protein
MFDGRIQKKDVWIAFTTILLFVILSSPYQLSNAVLKTEADITNDCSESYVLEGDKNVTVYHCDMDIGGEETVARATINGNIIQVEKEEIGEYGGYLILHELGHNIGYRHTEDGIMSPAPYDEFDSSLSDKEINIARKFDGIKIIDWSDEEDREYIISKNKKYKNIEKQNCRSLYYKDSFYKEWWEGNRIYNMCFKY